MVLAIHGNKGFSKYWLEYCKKHNIQYKIVNCYDNNIVETLADCDALLWHHHQASVKDVVFAKQLLFSLEHAGKVVFPDFKTSWHFDDKVGQKYLFESLNLPHVKSFVFYSKPEAMSWLDNTSFPKVFKLRTGAGSYNVSLIKTKTKAKRLVKKAFKKGFPQSNRYNLIKDRFRNFISGKENLITLLKGIYRFIFPSRFTRYHAREKGYIYFQDYIPDNDHDIRVVVIHGRAFAIKRMIRKNDFRASGSGIIKYEKHLFDESIIRLSFQLAEKMRLQSAAFDFVYDRNIPLLLEVSYAFTSEGYFKCPGYWDKEMLWHEEVIDPHGWMIENVIKRININS